MNIPEILREEVRQMVAAGHKIDAVKRIREVMGVSLNQAVRMMDEMTAGAQDGSGTGDLFAQGERAKPADRMASSDRVLRTIFAILLLVGLALGGLAFWLVQKERDFRKTAERVPAVIVDSAQSNGRYRPVYEYTWRGAVRRTTGVLAGSVRSRYPFTPGSKETLIISRKDPTQMHVDNFVGGWMWPILAAGAGGVLGFIGVIGWLVTRRG